MAVIKHGSGATSAFKTVKVSGQSDVVADDGSDDLTLAAGSNVTLTTNASTDTVTIAAAGGAALAGIDDQSSSLDDCITILDAEVVINEDGDDQDFRVEGDTNTHLLFADGGTERVGVRTAAPVKGLHVVDGALVKGRATFVLSGSIDVTGAGSVNVPGTNTKYLSELCVGDDITVTGETRTIKTITNDTTATVYEGWGDDLANDTSPECTPAAFSVQRSDGTAAVTVNGNRGTVLDVTGATPFVAIRNTAETEAGIFICDDAAPIAQFARIMVDSGSAESGLSGGFSIMTGGENLTGSVNATASTSVVGVGTAFTSELKVGDRLILRQNTTSDGDSETRAITAIADDTHLTVSPAFSDLGNDSTPAYECRAIQIDRDGTIGMGVRPDTGGEKVSVNGAIAFKEQHSTFVPSTVNTYSKLYSKREHGPRFGTASADLLKSSTEYLRVAYDAGNPDFELGTGELTAEGWFMWRGVSATSFELMSIGRWNESGLECVWLGTNDSFKMYIDGTTVINTGASSFTPTVGQWYHIAFTRDGSDDCRIFVDGTQVGSTANDTGTITGNNATGLDGFKVGNDSAGTSSWDGWIDEVRISDTARYTATFTPPTAAFTTDGNTVALYHMDGAASGTTFTDSSGNGQNLTAVNGATTEIGQAELYAFDGSANETKISPHNDKGEWEFYSKNLATGRVVRINMEEAIRDLGALTGKDYIKGS